MRDETYKVEKELENRHSIVNHIEQVPSTPIKGCPIMEGYLFKRTSNAFKTWNRRWFYLYDNKLVYRYCNLIILSSCYFNCFFFLFVLYRKRMGEPNVTIMEDDLRICTVKPVTDGERRFCFEVLSPSK